MWLPKYERRLLRSYCKNIIRCNVEEFFGVEDLISIVNPRLNKRKDSLVKLGLIAEKMEIIRKANETLRARELIKLRPNQEGSNAVWITLTLAGYNLGCKYNSRWLLMKLWSEENLKNHPLCYLISYIAGIVSTLLTIWLSKILFGSQ